MTKLVLELEAEGTHSSHSVRLRQTIKGTTKEPGCNLLRTS